MTAVPLLMLAMLSGTAAAQSVALVELANVRRAPLAEELDLTGSLTAPRTAALAPSVAGRIGTS